ncbi:MAG: N-acetylglucosaminidase [Anaerostipes sp.]|jgi:beta-N-acetylglucosaminidase|uniref:N-acetylglucosaminidase n=1 Tax=Anaerostipes sp. TaxID=1872530 RepID=UPI00399BFCEE
MVHYKKLLAAALTIGCTATTIPIHNANAATMKIGYNGKTRYYTGTQLTFDYKNKKLSSKYAGIQISNTNMVPYYYYLVKQGPKVKRSYSSKTGKIVLKYGKKTLTAYSGKRTYYLNGARKTFSVAPTKVKYYSTGSTIILMPAKETVQGLGMTYRYTSSSHRVSMSYLTNSSSVATTAQSKPAATGSATKTTTVYTNYAKTLSAYVTAEKKQHPAYGGKSISTSTYTTYINPAKDATHNYQFLRLNTYRPVNATAYNNLLNKKLKSGSVLKNKGNVLIAAAKKYNIDPVYLLCQTILETGYGQSVLSQGKSVTSVVSGKSVVKDRSTGKVTGFKTVNGKYITSKISKQKVYNLYGIKAYDSAPQLCGFSYAYYHKWTSVDKAIYGAAQYVSEQYIHNKTHNQNTLYKFRYHPNSSNLWHEYATDPAYAKQIGYIMYSQFRSVYASNATFTYDKPKFK